MKKILICMGSSCFARENRDNLRVIEEFLKNHGILDSVHIEGSLCMGQCHRGPNITINGNEYHEVRGEELPEILRKELIEL
ncbi:MAG: (2Fe-2S) ferredoxin domain-containing protein [Candidatus Cloacimonetes bacterium]|jgi:NADH:ubiquinone oxidoreductase subunit E|nr:(2Fe-2S) ferredoxin domain-containing protein [Candidatus Cloacimonadota bacterium]MDD2507258.1 (2Fe-2S) ferredoxin domain-containing protein [Candidatus Cloacimonadota bacterium]MDD4147979.1 (2Fe-2S) ferredoxin domain-containing protein [Candidatus Cloacimonadota bacterium]MDD4560419.1 (2Fe-2S) ferredoxin domain-containing protein [Candidatus Cloacimonadota bacterium]